MRSPCPLPRRPTSCWSASIRDENRLVQRLWNPATSANARIGRYSGRQAVLAVESACSRVRKLGPHLSIHSAVTRFARDIRVNEKSAQNALEDHPRFFHNSGRGKVVDVAECRSPPDLWLSQRPVYKSGESFGHIPLSPIWTGDDVAKLYAMGSLVEMDHPDRARWLIAGFNYVWIASSIRPFAQAMPEKIKRFVLAFVSLSD